MPRLLPLLSLGVVLLPGCVATGTHDLPYAPPAGDDSVAVSLVALNHFRHHDRLRIGLLQRADCDAAPQTRQLATLGSGLAEGGRDLNLIETRLPTATPLRLQVEHLSSVGLERRQCRLADTHTLAPGRAYQLRVANWSSPRGAADGFGCAFEVIAVDPRSGAELAVLRPDPQPWTDCR